MNAHKIYMYVYSHVIIYKPRDTDQITFGAVINDVQSDEFSLQLTQLNYACHWPRNV